MALEITPNTRKLLKEYVRSVADLIMLKDWNIEVDAAGERCTPDAYACVEILDGRKCAVISFGREFWASNGKERAHTIVHELLHCHTHSMLLLGKDLRDQVTVTTFKSYFRQLRRANEYCVDGLADAWAPFLPPFSPPLPDEPKKVKAAKKKTKKAPKATKATKATKKLRIR